MSSLDEQFILTRASIGANKDDTHEKMKKFDSKLDKLIALVGHMLHQNQMSPPDNDVDDGDI